MLLLEGVDMYGLGNWDAVAGHVATQDGKSCQQHYTQVHVEMLRHFVHKNTYDDWDDKLPLAEFAHNNAKCSATQRSKVPSC